VFVARSDGVLAGTALAYETYRQLDDEVDVQWYVHDGDSLAERRAYRPIRGSAAQHPHVARGPQLTSCATARALRRRRIAT